MNVLQNYSQQASFENIPDALQLMDGLRKCGIYAQLSIIQP
jgi:hypothetical protein